MWQGQSEYGLGMSSRCQGRVPKTVLFDSVQGNTKVSRPSKTKVLDKVGKDIRELSTNRLRSADIDREKWWQIVDKADCCTTCQEGGELTLIITKGLRNWNFWNNDYNMATEFSKPIFIVLVHCSFWMNCWKFVRMSWYLWF